MQTERQRVEGAAILFNAIFSNYFWPMHIFDVFLFVVSLFRRIFHAPLLNKCNFCQLMLSSMLELVGRKG